MLRLRLAPLLLSMSALMSGTAAAAAPKYYDVTYRAHFRPDAGVVDVEIALSGERLPSRIVLRVDSRRHKKFTSTDPLQIEPSHVTWQPHGHAASLRYQFVVDHQRSPQHYDSRMTADWAIFRAERMVPRASVTARRSLHSRATLEFQLPQGWAVATPYGSVGELQYTIDDPRRRFDQPAGWMLAGKIGSRNEKIADVRVVVAAPIGDSARRQDTLTFLKFTLPRIQEVFPELPRRLLIISAGDPMWRGGLSGPASLFVHSDRRAHCSRHPRRRGKRLDRRGARRILLARNAAPLRQHQRAAPQGSGPPPAAVGNAIDDIVRQELERRDDRTGGDGAASRRCGDPRRDGRQSKPRRRGPQACKRARHREPGASAESRAGSRRPAAPFAGAGAARQADQRADCWTRRVI
jgi:hypothetical protein